MAQNDFLAAAESAETDLKKKLAHLQSEYACLQVGRAQSSLVENLNVRIEDQDTSQNLTLKSLASISVPDAKTIFIHPWDKNQVKAIEKAVTESKLGLNPSNDGEKIILRIPALTTEKRQELTKLVDEFAEKTRIEIRRTREECLKKFRQLAKAEGHAQGEEKIFAKKLQEKIDAINVEVSHLAEEKKKEILQIS